MSSEAKDVKNEISLKVEDVMVREVITVDENVTVRKAATIMNKFEIGCLVVVRKGKAVGIVTERDLLKRVIAKKKEADKTKVKDIMSSPLVVAEPKMEIEEAVELMFKIKIKKLPVVDGKRLVGLVSLTDIARFNPAILKMLKRLYQKQVVPKHIKKVLDYYIV